MYTDSDGNTVW